MKNYTSTVAPENTIRRIEEALVKAGASNIAKSYENGRPSAITFTIIEPDTKRPMAIRMPANMEAVHQALRVKLKPKRGYADAKWAARIADQAPRTAWKLMQDWLEVQLSLIEMRQVELLQVFLPYVVMGGNQTFYAALKASEFRALPAPESE